MAVRPAKSKLAPCGSLITKLPEIRRGPLGETIMSVVSAIDFSSASILIPEASIARNHHDSRFGDAEPAAVLFRVVADLDTRRDADVLVHNDAQQLRITSYVDAMHQDTVIHL